MDRDDALATLPRAHALGLRLRELGADDGLIAECLGIAAEAVAPLLTVATAKLARSLGTHAEPDADVAVSVPAGSSDTRGNR